jgi:GT2 family glycosyltransferase
MTSVSVVVSTHNRAASLERTLATLVGQSGAPANWELIVVDNASRDSTRSVVASYEASIPNLRYVYEGELGLSAARNRGVAEAAGDIIVFTDDDVLAPPDWLAELVGALERCPQAGAAGGRVELLLPGPRPEWLQPDLEGFLAAADYGDGVHTLEPPRYPVGANMAVRREWLQKVGAFKTSLGRRGKSVGGSEEQELFLRLFDAGGRVVYAPNAALRHAIEPERLERRWFVRRAYAQGRSSIVLLCERKPRSRAELLGRSALALARVVAGPRSLPVNVFRRRRPWFTAALSSATWLGCAVEAFVLATSRSPRRGGSG